MPIVAPARYRRRGARRGERGDEDASGGVSRGVGRRLQSKADPAGCGRLQAARPHAGTRLAPSRRALACRFLHARPIQRRTMTMHAPNRTLLAALLAGALAACSGDSFMPTTPAGPTEVSESALTVIKVAPTELPETTAASFYAVKGEKREQRLYTGRADGSRGDEYLR